MSQETSNWLNTNTLIGFTEKRGNAWHYRASEQGEVPNHYVGAIPVEDVRKRLFHWSPTESEVTFMVGGKRVVDPTRKAIVRPDTETLLGIFKQGYKIHGYDEWLIKNVEQILHTSSGELQIGSSGLLKGGAVAWVQFETPETHEVAGVQFRPFITAATSLDGSLATTYITGGQLVVCDNTLSAGLAGADGKYKIRHSSQSLGQIETVRDALGLVFATTDDLMAEIYTLANKSVSDKVWGNFLDSIAAVPADGGKGRAVTLAGNKREALQNLWATDLRVAPWTGTAYGVVAAMNTYDQHLANVRGMSRPERNALNMVKGEFAKSDAKTVVLLDAVTKAGRALTKVEIKALVGV